MIKRIACDNGEGSISDVHDTAIEKARFILNVWDKYGNDLTQLYHMELKSKHETSLQQNSGNIRQFEANIIDILAAQCDVYTKMDRLR